MKNKLLSKMAAIAAFTFALFMLPSLTKAQVKCPYTIQNNLNCPVDFKYIIFQPGNCVAVCASGMGTLPPGGSYVVPCSDLCNNAAACNLQVNVTNVGGSTPTPNPVSVDSGTPAASGTATGGCNTINMTWSALGTNINP